MNILKLKVRLHFYHIFWRALFACSLPFVTLNSVLESNRRQAPLIHLSTTVSENFQLLLSDGLFSLVNYLFISQSLFFMFFMFLLIGSLTSIAAVALTWSSYLNSLTNNYIRDFITQYLKLSWNPQNHAPFSTYPDLAACLIIVIFFLISFRGVQVSTWFNNALACLNLAILGITAIGGMIYGRLGNLEFSKYTNGFHGIIKGASIVM